MNGTEQTAEVMIHCPLVGAHIREAACRACRFHTMGVYCSKYGRVVPVVVCEICLSRNPEQPCSMAQVHRGVVTIDAIKDRKEFCGLPRHCHASLYTDTPGPLHAMCAGEAADQEE